MTKPQADALMGEAKLACVVPSFQLTCAVPPFICTVIKPDRKTCQHPSTLSCRDHC
jgi:hypothetical protein